MTVERDRVVVVTPDLFGGGGGIARIAKATVRACDHYCRRTGRRLSVFALNDSGQRRDERYLSGVADYRGFSSSRIGLTKAVLAAQWRGNHAGTIYCHVNLAVLGVGALSGAPRYVVVAHGIDVWNALSGRRTAALRGADEVWAVSHFTGEVMRRKHQVSASKVRVIYNCLDPEWSPSGPPLPEQPFVLSVARLARADRRKGVDVLIRAFGQVAQGLGEWSLRIVGDGDDLPYLRQVAADAGIESRTQFLGAVSDEALAQLYRSCSFFALPSAKEGFGLVFLEAMSAGKAVLAASETAVPEIVLNGVTGRLVPYGDERGLGEAIRELAQDAVQRARLGAAGRERALDAFAYARYEAELAASLERLWFAREGRPRT